MYFHLFTTFKYFRKDKTFGFILNSEITSLEKKLFEFSSNANWIAPIKVAWTPKLEIWIIGGLDIIFFEWYVILLTKISCIPIDPPKTIFSGSSIDE